MATQPSWRLISVLFSSMPLQPALAMTLYQAAVDLFRKDETQREIAGDDLSGRVKNLREEALIGVLSGPAFEAKVETEKGSGTVRFLITREGLEHEEPSLTELPRPRKARRPRKELLN